MNDVKQTIVVVPCSGIGKPLGTVSRETAYELCENLRPQTTKLIALSKLVLGDPQTREQVRYSPAVTIDGCKQMCASKLVKFSGGTIAREVAVFEEFRHHRDFKPEGIAKLNPKGMQLARILAEEIAVKIDGIGSPDAGKGVRHA